MSNNKDRKDFNKLNINRDIKEEFMRTAKDIEDTQPTKSKSTKKPAVRGRPKGAKNKVKKPAKIAPVRIGAKGNNKAKKTTQGAGVQKPVETRREKVVRQLKASEYMIPVIQEAASIGTQGEVDVKDIIGVLRVELKCAHIDWGIVNQPLIDMFVRDYVINPVYLQEGKPPVAMRLVHKRHVDLSASDPAWSDIEAAAY